LSGVAELSVAGGEAAGGVAGAGSVAGGVVLCVVVLSVPLSLHAAMVSMARAEADARMIFFMVLSLQFTPLRTVDVKMHDCVIGFVTLRFAL
jgi:hypothetical protein